MILRLCYATCVCVCVKWQWQDDEGREQVAEIQSYLTKKGEKERKRK